MSINWTDSYILMYFRNYAYLVQYYDFIWRLLALTSVMNPCLKWNQNTSDMRYFTRGVIFCKKRGIHDIALMMQHSFSKEGLLHELHHAIFKKFFCLLPSRNFQIVLFMNILIHSIIS